MSVDARSLDRATPVPAPTTRDSVIAYLSKLSGEDFEREYMKQMVEDQEKGARMFEAYSKGGENKELRDFAKETLPKIREHLAEAKRIQKKLGA